MNNLKKLVILHSNDLHGDFTAEQLAEAICQEYQVELSKALADVTRLLATWSEIGIIE